MDKAATHIEAVCLVSILVGIVSSVIPQGKLKGAFSSFCALVFIFTVMGPFSSLKKTDFNIFSFRNETAGKELLSDISSAEQKLCQDLAENAIEEKLKEMGYEVRLGVRCKKEGDEYRVVSLVITGDLSSQQRSDVRDYLKKSFPDAEVSFGGDG